MQRTFLVVMMAAATAACGNDSNDGGPVDADTQQDSAAMDTAEAPDVDEDDATDDADVAPDDVQDTVAEECHSGPSPPYGDRRLTIEGSMTLQFDAPPEQEANGLSDCTATRVVSGVENALYPWRCPDCGPMFDATQTWDADAEACLNQWNILWWFQPEVVIGLGDGQVFESPGQFYYAEVLPPPLPSTRTCRAIEFNTTGEAAGLTIAFSGQFEIGSQAGSPVQGRVPPATYSCGWPKADPPPYTGSYRLAVGETLPDAILTDQCGEPVRLHDFAGRYLLIEIGGPWCGPCKTAAEEVDQLYDLIEASRLDVQPISVLSPGDILEESDVALLTEWASTYELSSPILADREWGAYMSAPPPELDGVAPTWLVVAPDLTVVSVHEGYSSAQTYMALVADVEAHHAAAP